MKKQSYQKQSSILRGFAASMRKEIEILEVHTYLAPHILQSIKKWLLNPKYMLSLFLLMFVGSK